MGRDLPTYEELLKIFSTEKLKPIGRIIIKICLGGLFVYSVIAVLYFTQYGSAPGKSEPEYLYVMIIIILLSILSLLENKIFTRMVKAKKITTEDISNPDSCSVLNVLKNFTLMQVVWMQVWLFSGLFLLLSNVQRGSLESYVPYGFLFFPAIMIYSVAKIFPTSKRAAQLVQENIYPLIEE